MASREMSHEMSRVATSETHEPPNTSHPGAPWGTSEAATFCSFGRNYQGLNYNTTHVVDGYELTIGIKRGQVELRCAHEGKVHERSFTANTVPVEEYMQAPVSIRARNGQLRVTWSKYQVELLDVTPTVDDRIVALIDMVSLQNALIDRLRTEHNEAFSALKEDHARSRTQLRELRRELRQFRTEMRQTQSDILKAARALD